MKVIETYIPNAELPKIKCSPLITTFVVLRPTFLSKRMILKLKIYKEFVSEALQIEVRGPPCTG